MRTVTSLTGYKHTDEAMLKMLKTFEYKSNHPMYGKKHKDSVFKLISKPGKLNSMFGQQHSYISKQKISDSLIRHLNRVGIYNINDSLI